MTNDVEGVRAPGDQPESDEALRRVYGPEAVFSRVGSFTLVHLDAPDPEEIARRVQEFDPDEFFFDDCPLCQSARAEGGHIVFDAPLEDGALEDTADGDSPSGI